MRKMEKGRSMVEMLGVLAIIGVLSVGGIYGYSVAMAKYKANEVLQVANMLSIMAETKNAGDGECTTLTNSELTVPAGTGLVEMQADANGDVTIQFQNENDSVAKQVAQLIDNDKFKIGTVAGCPGEDEE